METQNMKITRGHLRKIIKEEISRIFENPKSPIVFDDIQIKGNPNRDPAELDYLEKLHDAAAAMAFGYSDPFDSLATQLTDGDVTLAQAQDAAEMALDMLAHLDNAEDIGVYEASIALGL
jgi:hypothetical protein